jgi:hypothetical protein
VLTIPGQPSSAGRTCGSGKPMTPFLNLAARVWSRRYGLYRYVVPKIWAYPVGVAKSRPSREHSPIFEHCRDDSGLFLIGAVPQREALHVV